jgi:glycosyltransferase involved in cell wall biosynthesis
LKVLIVHPDLSFYGGAELLIVKLANYLTKKGIKNTILTLSISEEVKKEFKGTHIIALNKKTVERKNRISKLIDFINGFLILWKYVQINRKKYDVINVHNFPAEYSLFPFARNSVWMCNEPPIQLYLRQYNSLLLKIFQTIMKKFDRFIVRSSVKYSCVSDEFNAERFEKIYGIKPRIINYGIEYDFFSKGNEKNAKKMFNLYNNFILLQVGTLTPLKNQIESIKVVEKLKEKIPHIKLILVGLGEEKYEAMLKGYVQRKKLDKYVLFTGNLSRKIVRDLYKACDVALFPIKSQGGWLSTFEALCAGKPIIVSSSMTAANIIKRNELGIVTDKFAEAVMNVYKNQKKYNVIANKSKKWVKENLSWDKFCEGMLDLFEKAIS